MTRRAEPLFLASESYRYRRFVDAARVLPVVGIILLILPILWGDTARTAGGLMYVFGVWALLIGVVARVSLRLSRDAPEDVDSDTVPASPSTADGE